MSLATKKITILLFLAMISISARSKILNLAQRSDLLTIPASSYQLIVITPESGIHARLTAYQRSESQSAWQTVNFSPLAVVVGKEGIAAKGAKREGDKKTPAGLYSLGTAFGYQPEALKMDYRYITHEDKFIDDPQSPEYNSWVVGSSAAKNYENMRLSDDEYKLGVVINYNMQPVVKGKGSAIFMHIWSAPTIGTSGCIAMSEDDIRKLFSWLDKSAHPLILIRGNF